MRLVYAAAKRRIRNSLEKWLDNVARLSRARKKKKKKEKDVKSFSTNWKAGLSPLRSENEFAPAELTRDPRVIQNDE